MEEGRGEQIACRAETPQLREADMTGARPRLWVITSVLSTVALFGLSLAAFVFGRGDWLADPEKANSPAVQHC